MQNRKQKLILVKEDYDLIMANLRGGFGRSAFNSKEAAALEEEIKTAKLVSPQQMPDNVVRLNSCVTVCDEEGKVMQLTIVPPRKADIRQKKISVMSPIGTALIGYAKGGKVSWKVPAGRKTFTILDVHNQFSSP